MIININPVIAIGPGRSSLKNHAGITLFLTNTGFLS